MNSDELKLRTKKFAIQIVELVKSLPKDRASNVIAYQIMKSGTSVAANYRASCRAKSKADFISKIDTVLEESDETKFWLEMLIDSDISNNEFCNKLLKESSELTPIFAATSKTAKNNSGRFK